MLGGLEDGARADAGQENGNGQVRGEDALNGCLQYRRIRGVDLAQARRRQRDTVVALDQIGQLRRATALQERNHALLQIGHAPSSPPTPAGMWSAPRASLVADERRGRTDDEHGRRLERIQAGLSSDLG